jgi:diguanylate cyclase (GGDEF)-like protein/PAS domain S-box-containing protein
MTATDPLLMPATLPGDGPASIPDIRFRQRAEETLRAIFEHSPAAIYAVDREGNVLLWNPACETMFGWTAGEVAGRRLPFVPAHPDEGFERRRTHVFNGGTIANERATRVRKDRTAIEVVLSMSPIRDTDGEIIAALGVLLDITNQVHAQRELAHQSLHDPLTGLPNRTCFLDRLSVALGRADRKRHSVAVMFLDLDRFKVVNDSLGHDAGDRVLMVIADRLRQAVRPGDTIGRFGGDEFVILCEDINGEPGAVALAERVAKAVGKPINLDSEGDLVLTTSIGIALPRDDDETADTLLRDADAAMYRAKDRGRARHEVFDDVMRARAVAKLDVERELRLAIDRGELALRYQPEVSLRDFRIQSVEALLRWNHPQRGLLAPGAFLDLAEESGLIIPIGEWVLETACKQAVAWRDDPSLAGRAPSVWVNLSPRQLADPALPDMVARTLGRTGAEADDICLEITEGALMADPDTTLATLRELRLIGVRLAVDDFGTGYSSLAYLRRFPVHAVKVDRSFVDRVGQGPEDSAIVAAIVKLSEALGLQVVAEGVETVLQLNKLRELGCELAQGYLFSPPLDPDELTDLLYRRDLRPGGVKTRW